MKNLIYLAFSLTVTFGFSQKKTDPLKIQPNENAKVQFKDSPVLFFTNTDSLILQVHPKAALIDSLWMNKLIKSPLYDKELYILGDDEMFVADLEELSTELLKSRLKHLNSKTPFKIEYNPALEQVIRTYLQKRKSSISTIMERARYFFPMFEEHLAKYNIPMELKYLAVVESALNPNAHSRMGATGLWQFMYPTGKFYNLEVSSYIDERSDPYRATEAACKYLESLYKIYGDWSMVLAAYNYGPGNVSKAIRRAGGSTNYWNIRQFLPRETAAYVPAFYATLYIFEYAKEHNLKSKEKAISYYATDTVRIKRQLTFTQINEALNVDIEVLKFLNPQYKLEIIPYVKDKNYALTLPLKDIGNFVSNEKMIYAYADLEDEKEEKPLQELIKMEDRITHKVKKGEYLGKIAAKHGVAESNLKKWNNLKSSRLQIGQKLVVYPKNTNPVVAAKVAPTNSDGKQHSYYIVKLGDSLWSIAKKYSNVSVQNIKEWNNIWSVKSLKPGIKLKIFN
ncbi:MAG: LysM peptidoglycan-binding domain-containing protein [Lutibacter sp.]|nr:LysM peptidoglycan-binding domain-containing protein [Lutibacter sp.]MDT8418629.1 LysM peptidoglycan-binding domain-containing protein [Lutibacter sp.]